MVFPKGRDGRTIPPMTFTRRLAAALTLVAFGLVTSATAASAVDYCTQPDGSVIICETTVPTTDSPITTVSTTAPATDPSTTRSATTTTTRPKATTTTGVSTTPAPTAASTAPEALSTTTVPQTQASVSYVELPSTVPSPETSAASNTGDATESTILSNLISSRTRSSSNDTGLSTLSLVLILACVLWILAVLAYFIIDRPVARR